DVELDLVAVGVDDAERVGDRVVAGADDAHPRLLQPAQCGAQLVVAVAHLEAEVVHADAAAGGDGLGGVAHLTGASSPPGGPPAPSAAGRPGRRGRSGSPPAGWAGRGGPAAGA